MENCFSVSVVNKPGHLVEFRPTEVQFFYSTTKQFKTFLSRPKSLDRVAHQKQHIPTYANSEYVRN